MQTNPALFSKEHDITSFASTDPGRYVIQSVHYNAKGKFLEACNGRQLVRVPVETTEEFPPITGANGDPLPDCILATAPFQKALRSIPKSNIPVLEHVALTAVEGEPLKVRLTTNDFDSENSSVVRTIDGKYPNTEQVIPDKSPTFAIALSATELKILVDYCAKHHKEGAEGITFQFIDELSPVRWSVKTEQNRKVTGVLMPMRMS